MFKTGQQVIWIAHDLTISPMKKRLFSGVVTKVNKDIVFVNNQHKQEDCLNASFVWPDVPSATRLLLGILSRELQRTKEDKETMAEMMQLNNRFIQQGLK